MNWRSFGTEQGGMDEHQGGEAAKPPSSSPNEGRGGHAGGCSPPGLSSAAVTRLSGQQLGEGRRGGGACRCPQGTRSPAMLGWTFQIALSP